MGNTNKKLWLVLAASLLCTSNVFANCWQVPAALFHAAEVPTLARGKDFTFSGSGLYLGLFLQEKDGRTRMLRLQREKMDELFLAPPAGQSFRSPRWTLWDGGEAAAVDDERFFAVYLGGSLIFYEEKRYRGEVWPAFRNGEVFWSPHLFDLSKARKADVVRGAYLSSAGEHQVWSVSDINWDASLPEIIDKLEQGQAFAIPSKNRVWVVEPFRGNVYDLRGGKARQVFSPQEKEWVRWSEGEAKEEIAKKVEEVKKTKLAEAEALLLGDATQPKREKKLVDVKFSEPYFRKGFARNDELLLQMNVAKPEKAVLWFRGTEAPVCLSFKLIFEKSATWAQDLQSFNDGLAVTEEAVWLRKPFGFVLLDEVAQWLANQSQPEPLQQER